jgi:HlyD family secretion protein
VAFIVLSALLGSYIYSSDGAFEVSQSNLTLAKVQTREIASSIAVRGVAVPEGITILSSPVSGRVETVLVNAGDTVEEGSPIVTIANIESKLAINSNISRIEAELNNLHSQTIEITRSRFADRKLILDTEFSIDKLTAEISRKEELVSRGVFPAAEAVLLRNELEFQRNILTEIVDIFEKNDLLRQQQETSIERQRERLESNLALARQRLAGFVIKAPKAGQIVNISIEEGQAINVGEIVSQIDQQTGFKVETYLDEFYLDKISVGDVAVFQVRDQVIDSTVRRVFPEVKDGVFRVEFSIALEGRSLRAGQALQGTLKVTDPRSVLTVSNGSFMDTSNGNWVYVLSGDQQTASKRFVRLVSVSEDYLEVESGLSEDEVVIVSEYASFDQVPLLRLTK